MVSANIATLRWGGGGTQNIVAAPDPILPKLRILFHHGTANANIFALNPVRVIFFRAKYNAPGD